MIDKKDRLKRSSNVSTTPSTDSSKSSKTFEFLDYDEETKEKVLEEAIKEEDSFLEFVKTLKIEVDPIVDTGSSSCLECERTTNPSVTSTITITGRLLSPISSHHTTFAISTFPTSAHLLCHPS